MTQGLLPHAHGEGAQTLPEGKLTPHLPEGRPRSGHVIPSPYLNAAVTAVIQPTERGARGPPRVLPHARPVVSRQALGIAHKVVLEPSADPRETSLPVQGAAVLWARLGPIPPPTLRVFIWGPQRGCVLPLRATGPTC